MYRNIHILLFSSLHIFNTKIDFTLLAPHSSSLSLMAKSLEQLFDDLLVRFIINSQIEEIASIERLGFLIEQAYWFYDDFYYDQNPNDLPKFSNLKAFAVALHAHCPQIFPFPPTGYTFEQEFGKFLKYKSSIPVIGAVMLDSSRENVLLVQGYNSKVWTFPKGKINQNESYPDCAAREVFEETSFDISPLVKKNNYIELLNENQLIRLYVVENVPKEHKFWPRTRKEIRNIQWFSLHKLWSTKPTNLTVFLNKLKKFFRIKFETPTKALADKKTLLSFLKSNATESQKRTTESSSCPQLVNLDLFRHSLAQHVEVFKSSLLSLK
jgi:8-oxo-dGTP pyrophosphatase MutT (NUDIX family)